MWIICYLSVIKILKPFIKPNKSINDKIETNYYSQLVIIIVPIKFSKKDYE